MKYTKRIASFFTQTHEIHNTNIYTSTSISHAFGGISQNTIRFEHTPKHLQIHKNTNTHYV